MFNKTPFTTPILHSLRAALLTALLIASISACTLTAEAPTPGTDSGADGGADGGASLLTITDEAGECVPPAGWFVYTIVRGDTLFDLAQRTESSIADLTAANCLTDPNRLRPGDLLYVPVRIDGTAAQPQPPASAPVQFYLIAAQGVNASGIAVGCDDTAVPVLAIGQGGADTSQNIEGALAALFLVSDYEYGQSGLENQLHDSDLVVESVTFNDGGADGGEAIIELGGTLMLIGTCGDARIEAQMLLTIFQFPEVQTALIRLNGRNLREYFDQSGQTAADFRYQRGAGILRNLP